MRCLADTNTLLRLADTEDAQHALVARAAERLVSGGDDLVIVPQCLYEFWSVVTRPRIANGLGWTAQRARDEVDILLQVFPLLPDTPAVLAIWLELVTTHDVRGKQVHDARLVAAALAHGVDNLLTLNVPDFRRFGVPSLHPSDVIA
jgi:predicted nucleic acid-binding protein